MYIRIKGKLKKMMRKISLTPENGQENKSKKLSIVEKMIYHIDKKDTNLIYLFKKISGQEKQRNSNIRIPKELIRNHYVKVFKFIIDPLIYI